MKLYKKHHRKTTKAGLPFLLNRVIILQLFSLISLNVYGQKNSILTYETYESKNRVRSGLSLGSLGTGSIELRKDGQFHNWSIFNNYPLGTGPMLTLPTRPNSNDEESFLFFLVKYKEEGKQPKIKLLHLTEPHQEGALLEENPIYYFPWMSAVDKIEYAANFPVVNMKYSDDEMPFDLELQAFSPFIPHDVDDSSIPGIYFDFNVISKSDKDLEVMVVASMRNLVAYDKVDKYFTSEVVSDNQYKYFIHSVGGVDSTHTTNGEMSLGAFGGDEVSYYTGWAHRHPYYERMLSNNTLGNINDLPGRNMTKPDGSKIGYFNDTNNQISNSSIAVTKKLPAGGSFKANFFMNWYFPNAFGAVNEKEKLAAYEPLVNGKGYSNYLEITQRTGHYYENLFKNVYEVVEYFVNKKTDLKKRTLEFLNDFYETTTDLYILNQINSHLNTFITSSTFDKKGRFGIREGLTANKAWGPNITADVSLYGSAPIIALFPELQKSSMRAHKALQGPNGEINHGLGFDLGKTQNGTFGVVDRLDLVPNYIQLVLRDYFWTNDKAYLEEMWPSIESGIEYMLNERDMNADMMPDMEGIMCSYDNFPMYGMASYIQSQWIVTMKMAALAAKDLSFPKLSAKYDKISKDGINLMDKHLWNGSYYNLYNDYSGDKGEDKGCLTDQLIGQWVAHTSGMGRLFDSERVSSSMDAILASSFIEDSYLRNCTWPENKAYLPMAETDLWVDQANTPWTGVELAFASFLIYEGKTEEGKAVIKAVDDRYRKAGLYWDHQEFGGHYYRPMSSWSILNALSGFVLKNNHYSFSPNENKTQFKYFFSANAGTGFLEKNSEGRISLQSRSGQLSMKSLALPVGLWAKGRKYSILINGSELNSVKAIETKEYVKLVFQNEIVLTNEDVLSIDKK